jgi:hypothetical protein
VIADPADVGEPLGRRGVDQYSQCSRGGSDQAGRGAAIRSPGKRTLDRRCLVRARYEEYHLPGGVDRRKSQGHARHPRCEPGSFDAHRQPFALPEGRLAREE